MSSRPGISSEIRREILSECGHRCAVCGTPFPLDLAHIIAWHKSREHKAEDLICLCANCHAQADRERWGEKTLREYKQRPWVLRQYKNAGSIPGPTSKVELKIEMELEHFDERDQRWLQYGIAAFLEISPNAVRIVDSTEESSVKVTIELPRQSAERLLSAYERSDSELCRYLAPLVLLDLRRGLTGRERIPQGKVLLETTIQLYRVADDPNVKQRIDDALSDKDNYTTSYVFREFLRTIIKDIAYIHSAVETVDKDADGRVALGNLDRFLARGEGNFSARAARRERLVTGAILDKFPETKIPSLKLLRFLEMTAQQWIEDFFEVPSSDGKEFRIEGEYFLTGLDEHPDEMLHWIYSHHPIPPPPPFPKGAARFLHSRRDLVRRAEESMQAAKAREKDGNLLKLLERLKDKKGEYNFLNKLKPNTRGNWTLGDLLIALEAPPDVYIYTNDRHFVVLCKALGKRRYIGGYVPKPRQGSP